MAIENEQQTGMSDQGAGASHDRHSKDLTPRQSRFVEEYLVDLHITKAAIRAGYSARSAYSTGHRLMRNAEIQNAISKARAKLSESTKISAERVLDAYAKIAFGGLSKFLNVSDEGAITVDLRDCTPEDLNILSELVVEDIDKSPERGSSPARRIRVKMLDRLRALEALSKHLGLFEPNAGDQQGDSLLALIKEVQRRGSKPPIRK